MPTPQYRQITGRENRCGPWPTGRPRTSAVITLAAASGAARPGSSDTSGKADMRPRSGPRSVAAIADHARLHVDDRSRPPILRGSWVWVAGMLPAAHYGASRRASLVDPRLEKSSSAGDRPLSARSAGGGDAGLDPAASRKPTARRGPAIDPGAPVEGLEHFCSTTCGCSSTEALRALRRREADLIEERRPFLRRSHREACSISASIRIDGACILAPAKRGSAVSSDGRSSRHNVSNCSCCSRRLFRVRLAGSERPRARRHVSLPWVRVARRDQPIRNRPAMPRARLQPWR